MTFFLCSMTKDVPLSLCLAFDHTNYARWLSAFIKDSEPLNIENKELFDEIGNHLYDQQMLSSL